MKKLLMLCYITNILMVMGLAILILSILFKIDFILNYVSTDSFTQIRMILTIPVFVLWVNNLILWSKKDKSVGRFFLLFFLNGLYNPFYFRRILKNEWQK